MYHGEIALSFVGTNDMEADILTKPLVGANATNLVRRPSMNLSKSDVKVRVLGAIRYTRLSLKRSECR